MASHQYDLAQTDLPPIAALLKAAHAEGHQPATLLAVCPISPLVVEAALLAASEANAPLLLAATLNQVDQDGGYTGWRPHELMAFIAEAKQRLCTESVPVWVGLDHGGPWMRDADAHAQSPLADAMTRVKASIVSCLNAGYALLHIDPTADPHVPSGTSVPKGDVLARTIELIDHAEQYRVARGLPAVSYEVGTEEVSGGLHDLADFEAFLAELDAALVANDLIDAKPIFVVANVGTSLGASTFDESLARTKTGIALQYHARLKGHYSDFAEAPEAYPRAGIGGANVGPGLAAIEYDAMCALAKQATSKVGEAWQKAMDDAIKHSGRWKKWVTDPDATFDSLPHDTQRFLLRTGSRYVGQQPAVKAARSQLFATLPKHVDGPKHVRDAIKVEVMRYMVGFNLCDFASRFETT